MCIRDRYQAYEQYLAENRMMDFDDILRRCYELFIQRPDILAGWQRKFTHILIDEFQDINALQYAVIRMSVSYTHLDVYKRQSMWLWRN